MQTRQSGRVTAAEDRSQSPADKPARTHDALAVPAVVGRTGGPEGEVALGAEQLVRLQRSVGNAAVVGLLGRRDAAVARATRTVSATSLPSQPGLSGCCGERVQRHGSFEHRLLGDVKPDDLFQLGARWKLDKGVDEVTVHDNVENKEVAVKRDNVLHVLEQELRRLRAWQTAESNVDIEEDLSNVWELKNEVKFSAAPEGAEFDKTWDVKVVVLPSRDGSRLPVTYGELNTLADFYGSVDTMTSVAGKALRNTVQSVRRQSYDELSKLYKEVAGDLAKEEVTAPQEFAGSFNISGIPGEVGMMANDSPGGGSSNPLAPSTTSYRSTLARNACHFAPESWHSWEDHHRKALAAAEKSFDLQQTARGQEGKAKATSEADARLELNKALIYNGFGDHYLQDSYAGGHLMNKTAIMQMYVRWLDKQPGIGLSLTTDTTWRMFQSVAYNQDKLTSSAQYNKDRVGTRKINGVKVSTAQNPQAVENTQGMKDFGWQQRLEMLGLQVPSAAKPGSKSWKVLVWLQKQRGSFWQNRYDLSFTRGQLVGAAREMGLTAEEVPEAIRALMDANIIYRSNVSTTEKGRTESTEEIGERLDNGAPDEALTGSFTLRKEYVISMTGQSQNRFDASTKNAQTRDETVQDSDQVYNRMSQAVAYKEFTTFLKDSYLQKSTNAAHDYFCKQGLQVSSEKDGVLFRIYGDDNMMNKESEVGLKQSATTANMSRDAIFAMADEGEEPAGGTTRDILDRLPAFALPPEGTEAISLADWHERGGVLETWLADNVFAKMDPKINAAMGVVGASGGLGKMSQDEDVHGSEIF
ncbi:MAG TPA: hypothetical protein VHT30_12640 [Acidimicrobiales bacterium]|jgi:hypothetical protein|nr:hypothetical protein [Acidimicrobiales bacterium]